MWLIDQLAEQHIRKALAEGELDNLPGSGVPLKLDDDRHVPVELRAGYRLMKNAGYLPPELEMRREAVELNDLLSQCEPEDRRYEESARRLRLLEFTLTQAGFSTDFLYGDYARQLRDNLK